MRSIRFVSVIGELRLLQLLQYPISVVDFQFGIGVVANLIVDKQLFGCGNDIHCRENRGRAASSVVITESNLYGNFYLAGKIYHVEIFEILDNCRYIAQIAVVISAEEVRPTATATV